MIHQDSPHVFVMTGVAETPRIDVAFTVRVPEVTHPEPTMVFRGLGGIQAAYSNFADKLADKGLSTVTFETNGSDSHASYAVMKTLDCGSTGKELRRRGINTALYDALAHSLGGHSATEAAGEHPDKFCSVTYAGSVGMRGSNHVVNAIESAVNLAAFAMTELVPATIATAATNPELNTLEAMTNVVSYIWDNPLRTLQRVATASTCDIRRGIDKLHMHGVTTAILDLEADNLCPTPSRMLSRVNFHEKITGAYHTSPQAQPELVAQAFSDILHRIHSIAQIQIDHSETS